MKRLIWLVLAAFGIALAQVQPVVPVPAGSGARACCCGQATADSACHHDAAKTMDHCLPDGGCCPALNTLLPATAIAVVPSPTEISRLNWLAEKGRRLAYPPLLTPPRLVG